VTIHHGSVAIGDGIKVVVAVRVFVTDAIGMLVSETSGKSEGV
jgi:hypothetical protein